MNSINEAMHKLKEGIPPFSSQKIGIPEIRKAIKDITGEDLKIVSYNERKCIIKQKNKINKNVRNVHVESIDNPIFLNLFIDKDNENNFKIDLYKGSIFSMRSAAGYKIHTRGENCIKEFEDFKNLVENTLKDYKNDSFLELSTSIIAYSPKKEALTENDLKEVIQKFKKETKENYGLDINIEANIINKFGKQISLFDKK